MTNTDPIAIRPGACARCGGAGYFDRLDSEWRCLLCGRTVNQRPGRTAQTLAPVAA